MNPSGELQAVPSTGLPSPAGQPGFRHAFRVHCTVVGALMLREVRTRFGRHRLGYVWALVQPALHIGTWFVIRSVLRQSGGAADMSGLLFLATGIVPFLSFSDVASFVKGSISANRPLLAFPPVRNIDAIVARFLLESATMIIVGTATFAFLMWIGEAGWPARFDQVALATGGVLLLGLGFGAFNSIAALLSPTYGKLLASLQRILYFTSGLFFSPESMPKEVLWWLSWNPVLHGVELFRMGYSSLYISSVASIWYLLAWALGFLLVGLSLERMTRPRLRELQ
jgi:capsular polysaccharide transport system permease protein